MRSSHKTPSIGPSWSTRLRVAPLMVAGAGSGCHRERRRGNDVPVRPHRRQTLKPCPTTGTALRILVALPPKGDSDPLCGASKNGRPRSIAGGGEYRLGWRAGAIDTVRASRRVGRADASTSWPARCWWDRFECFAPTGCRLPSPPHLPPPPAASSLASPRSPATSAEPSGQAPTNTGRSAASSSREPRSRADTHSPGPPPRPASQTRAT